MARTTDAREKALAAAERLFRTQGYAATGLAQVLEESGAPKGSFYFHFPGGKEQLAREALHNYGARVEAGLRALAERSAGDPHAFVDRLCKATAQEMKAGNWEVGCAALSLANELAPAHAEFADTLKAVFQSWTKVIANALAPACASPAEAARRALALLAALEGARILARTTRSAAPFDAVAAEFRARAAPKP